MQEQAESALKVANNQLHPLLPPVNNSIASHGPNKALHLRGLSILEAGERSWNLTALFSSALIYNFQDSLDEAMPLQGPSSTVPTLDSSPQSIACSLQQVTLHVEIVFHSH